MEQGNQRLQQAEQGMEQANQRLQQASQDMEQAEASFRVRLEQLQDELRSADSKAEELERHASERLSQAEAIEQRLKGIGSSSCTGLRSSMRKPASLLPHHEQQLQSYLEAEEERYRTDAQLKLRAGAFPHGSRSGRYGGGTPGEPAS